MTPPLRLALFLDPPDEGWPSMDLVGEALAQQLLRWPDQVLSRAISPTLPRAARRVLGRRFPRKALNVDRLLGRFASYPVRAASLRHRFDTFHVVDHSYAQLANVLPAERTGVFCHDMDAFRSVLGSPRETRSPWFRAMARTTLRGLSRARWVFHSTQAVRQQLVESRAVDPSRLVWAPYGVSPEFVAEPRESDATCEALQPLNGHPYLLHVGSSIPRKRLDLLFQVFAQLLQQRPELRLVQQGGALTEAQRAQVKSLGITHALLQPPKLERSALAVLYRRARAVLVPSEAEGFGLPVIEALACGAQVVASDIAPLKEAGGKACHYAPVGDVEAWVAAVGALLDETQAQPPLAERLDHARRFTWEAHARTILNRYLQLDSASH